MSRNDLSKLTVVFFGSINRLHRFRCPVVTRHAHRSSMKAFGNELEARKAAGKGATWCRLCVKVSGDPDAGPGLTVRADSRLSESDQATLSSLDMNVEDWVKHHDEELLDELLLGGDDSLA